MSFGKTDHANALTGVQLPETALRPSATALASYTPAALYLA